MNSDDHPPWLKAMQNGSIGEARSRAFLLDRFWVLDRSVDIDGADFIIQRRLTQKTLLDREAPRLGIVQAKYFGSDATTHHIHKQYVVDEHGESRDEFFVLCHFGDEEDAQMFLLGAKDIRDNFPISGGTNREKFRVAYKDLYNGTKFKVSSKRNALSRIERQLELADFTRNRSFLSWMLPDAGRDLSAILPLYREPIDNYWGDLPKSFEEIKKTAKKAMMEVEDVHEKLARLTAEVDPLAAQVIIEEISYACRDGRGNWSITLPSGLDSEDFFTACRQHKFMVNRLTDDGLLDAFLKMKEVMRKKIFEFLQPNFPFDKNLVHHFILRFEPSNLLIKSIESKTAYAADFFNVPDVKNKYGNIEVGNEYAKIIDSQPGHIEYCWLPGRYRLSRSAGGDTFEMYLLADFSLYRDCLATAFEQRYGEVP